MNAPARQLHQSFQSLQAVEPWIQRLSQAQVTSEDYHPVVDPSDSR
jgi:hypothetical protein